MTEPNINHANSRQIVYKKFVGNWNFDAQRHPIHKVVLPILIKQIKEFHSATVNRYMKIYTDSNQI
ncbi:hypothetical protein FJ651_08995 [Paucihalobacter ruber]|uniref:Uncharacterized protein n=1 Tax=Paucihalobacter ruber TaxID=2567861 RepID=A0A506PJG1_9FLAO|nr:hypothetical protein [Paucihalobacter ruber]TPV33222.1 hypothetical protein FJ651_08995 [Paucihalobacter ruber]